MDINWTTFTAQIINFLVLVWLLKRFLYGPIVRAMDERERLLAAQLEQAQAEQNEAKAEAEQFRQKSAELNHAREELLAEAGREVDVWKKEHRQEAREEVDHARAEWYRAIDRERNAFLRDLRQRAGQQVHQMTRRVLRKLCQMSVEDRVIDEFTNQLQQVDSDKRQEIAAAVKNSHHHVTVETAFSLSADRQQEIQQIVRDKLSDGIDIDFDVAPELICGIELRAAGYKVAWSANETLDELEDEFAAALDSAVASQ